MASPSPGGAAEAKKETKKKGGWLEANSYLLNHNVIFGLCLIGAFSFANNIFQTNVFPNFLLEVANDDKVLFGMAEALQGLAQLVMAFPIG